MSRIRKPSKTSLFTSWWFDTADDKN